MLPEDSIQDEKYVRAKISMTLTVVSPLHIGTGERAPLTERVSEDRKALKKEITEGTYRPMSVRWATTTENEGKSAVKRAYIPGSTLKGAMLAELSGLKDKGIIGELFGFTAASATGEKWERRIGRVRFRDSEPVESPTFKGGKPPLWSEKRGTGVRARVGIDPVTGAASRHHLAFNEYVPEGSTFKITLEAHDISARSLEVLASRLKRFAKTPLRIGAGASMCAGELLIEEDRLAVAVLSEEKFREWATQKVSGPFSDHFETLDVTTSSAEDQGRRWTMTFRTLDPLLVSSGLDRAEKTEDNKQKTDEHADQLSVLRTTGGHILIPASTMRGAIRGRARKILIVWIRELWTRLPESRPSEYTGSEHAGEALAAGAVADKLLGRIFGSTNIASSIQMTDFRSSSTFDDQALHHQYFNAIDRFTGGVAKGALYEARATPVGTRFEGSFGIRPGTQLGRWAKLLLGLVLRDLAAGEIALGWGKAKGYGTILLEKFENSEGNKLPGRLAEELQLDMPPGDDWLIEALNAALESHHAEQQAADHKI